MFNTHTLELVQSLSAARPDSLDTPTSRVPLSLMESMASVTKGYKV